ncbi:MAG: aldehyde dehydrogenase family protein [Phenylobacterium sp.]|nr:aldehyde dehydrogenase family protein [Phenylobacterium sp.]
MDGARPGKDQDAKDQGDECLAALTPGMVIPYGGDRLARVSPELAGAFRPGDQLIVLQDSGTLLHVPAAQKAIAADAVGRAQTAFARMGEVSDDQITAFFDAFADRLADEAAWTAIAQANAADVARAQQKGRSTTRLAVSPAMRADMIAGLRAWRDSAPARGRVIEAIDHPGWRVEQLSAALGVVAFVFEGRPNVFADATGVLRAGNSVVFRIGSDALGTARAIVAEALDPAIAAAGLPPGSAVLVDSAEHAAGWAMFGDPRLGLAVARGSGPAVTQLGGIARQAGVPVSLHGTGGAWMAADASADPERLFAAVFHSLDRKVCNTLNVFCATRDGAEALIPVFLAALDQAGARGGHGVKLHVVEGDEGVLPPEWRTAQVQVSRAGGVKAEPKVEILPLSELGREWEWEQTPEVTLKVVADLEEAVRLFNRYSPQFAASLISTDPDAHARFYATINAPFVGDGFTRWVDGQYALNKPELGLSNWEFGRLFARGGVLAGDGVFTVRARVSQSDIHLDRGGAPTPARRA